MNFNGNGNGSNTVSSCKKLQLVKSKTYESIRSHQEIYRYKNFEIKAEYDLDGTMPAVYRAKNLRCPELTMLAVESVPGINFELLPCIAGAKEARMLADELRDAADLIDLLKEKFPKISKTPEQLVTD